MIKKWQDWFIGEFLREIPDIIERTRIILLYRILLLALALLAVVIPIMVVNEHYNQLIRAFLVIACFIFALFSLKKYRSVEFASHFVIAVATANLIANIYILLQEINGVNYLLAVANILFAFYFLRWRWMIFYVTINSIAVVLFIVLQRYNLYHIAIEPESLPFSEFFICLTALFTVIIAILWHFRIAFSISSKTLSKALNKQKKLTQKYLHLNKELTEAKDKAEEMNRLKTNFLNNMSHEIRTPLNGILGIAQIIEDEADNQQIKEYVAIQKKSGERLLNTINSILHLSRLEAEGPEFDLKKVEINQLVEECFHSLKALAHQKKLGYHFVPYPEPLYCLSDPPMLYQVMNNLIGNAIKFTHSGSITVSTGIFEKSPKFLFIRVQDTGIGINQEFLSRLFNPFVQESSGRSRQYEGSGLGLSIAQKYVELLGGSIIVKSEKEVGSTFDVQLPINP